MTRLNQVYHASWLTCVYINILFFFYPVRCAHNPPPCRIFISWNGFFYDFLDFLEARGLIFWWFLSILGAWKPVLEAWVTFWAQGSDFYDFWDLFDHRERVPPFWPKNDQKSFKNRSQTQQVFRSLFWSTLEPSWGRFGRILGAKMEPKLVQNRSQERSWRKFKNH